MSADPFDSDDDIFSSINLEALQAPPPKRSRTDQEPGPSRHVPSAETGATGRVSSNVHSSNQQDANRQVVVIDLTEDDTFESDDDKTFCDIADALETSVNEEKIVVCGPPHPLHIPDICDQVLSYLNTPSSLLAARQVCTSWKDALGNKPFELATFRNVNHLVSRWPYGLGIVESSRQYKPPTAPPEFERIHVADPCTIFSKPEVASYFRRHGSRIKHFEFDANLYCKHHWKFLRNVVINWCDNLNTLVLLGVTCTDSLNVYSQLGDDFSEYEDFFVMFFKTLSLNKLVVKCKEEPTREHHHFSSVNTARFSYRYYRYQRGECEVDGGLLSRLMLSSPNVTEFTFHFNFQTLTQYLANMRMYGVRFTRLNVLELVGVANSTIELNDIRTLRASNLTLKTLKLGPFRSSPTQSDQFNQFLTSQAESLEHLELLGVKTLQPEPQTLATFTFTFPEMPVLKTLRITNVDRFRFGNLTFTHTTPALTDLELISENVPPQHTGYAERSIEWMFTGDYERELQCLKRFTLRGSHAHTVDHNAAGNVMRALAPKLESLGVSCVDVRGCLSGYSGLRELKNVSVEIGGRELVSNFTAVDEVFTTDYPSIMNLSVSTPHNTLIRPEHVNIRSLYCLTIDGFILPEAKSEVIARKLAETVNYTHFTNCKIVKPWWTFGDTGRSSRPLHNVTLTLVNLPVLAQDLFRVN